MRLLSLLFLFFFGQAYAQVSYRLESPEKVILKKKLSIIRIDLRKDQKKVDGGTGFFISKNGFFITNHHVLKKYLSDKTIKLTFKLADGKYLKKVYLGQCSNKQGIDLCLFQTEDAPSWPYLAPSFEQIGVGNKVFSYGNCGEEFKKKEGEILQRIKNFEELAGTANQGINIGVEMVRTSVPICGGDSGGPLFSQQGDLIGVNTRNTLISGKEYSVAITANDILKFFEEAKSKPFELISND